jgi:hypothetical protein
MSTALGALCAMLVKQLNSREPRGKKREMLFAHPRGFLRARPAVNI